MVSRRAQAHPATVKSEPLEAMSASSGTPLRPSDEHVAEYLSTAGMADNPNSPEDDSGYSSRSDNAAFSSDSIEALGQKTSMLINAINQLEQAGVEASGLPLPKVVAVGDQSAGKSSLIEAISEIRVPRAANTCTRCPLQISLAKGETPSWKITVHNKYLYDHLVHAPLRGAKKRTAPTSDVDFGPWRLLDRPEDVAIQHLKHEGEVEGMIARAQLATLTPWENPADILRGVAPTRPALEFSPNVVKLDIVGPNLPALTLYDLPGIITQSTSEDDDSLPELIRGLARDYIRHDNTIVMLACPIGTDHVNSNAARLVKDLGATSRCVGVITKPDKLDMSDHVQWAEMLSGQKFALEHGYFVTKQPGADEMLDSHAQAREKEARFFQQDKRWTSQHLAPFQHRFGTPKLQGKLSELLGREIEKALPGIERQVIQRISHLEAELENYPKPNSNAYPIVLGIVAGLQSRTKEMMNASSNQRQFSLDWKNLRDAYSQTLKEMKPAVVVNTGAEEHWRMPATYSNPISLDSDDEDATPCPPPSRGAKRPMPGTPHAPHTPNKRQRTTPSTAPRNGTSKPDLSPPGRALYDYPPADLDRPKEYAQKFTLQGIRQAIRDEATSGIPRLTDPNAEDNLIKKSLSNWGVPLETLFENMLESLQNHLLNVAMELLQGWDSTPLHAKTRDAALAFVTLQCAACRQRAERYLQAKSHKPTTLNKEVLAFYRQNELEFIQDHRRKARARAYVKSRYANKEFEAAELGRKMDQVKDADLGTDPFNAEISIMSDVRAYYNLAAGNMVDSICEMVQFEVFDVCARELQGYLMERLGLCTPQPQCLENAKNLLVEDPARLAQRERLEMEKERLKNAKVVLDSLKA